MQYTPKLHVLILEALYVVPEILEAKPSPARNDSCFHSQPENRAQGLGFRA